MSEAAVTVTGNVVRAVENRNTKNGAKVCKFVVASSRSWRGEEGWEQSEPSYFDVECWGRLAENVSNTLYKGQSVVVHGHVRTDRWLAEDGQQRNKQKIVAKAVGPNLRHHVAAVRTLTEKEHAAPVGSAELDSVPATGEALVDRAPSGFAESPKVDVAVGAPF